MLNDSEPIRVTFACCGEKRVHPFSALKTSPANFGFICPVCSATVQYDCYEFVALMNKDSKDTRHEITLRPVE